jgi:hypothetical protein
MKHPDQKEKKDNQSMKHEKPNKHQGGPSASRKSTEKNEKDESKGSDRNTTKRQGNSI